MNHFLNHWQNLIFWFKLQNIFQSSVEFPFVSFFRESVFCVWISGKQHNFLRNMSFSIYNFFHSLWSLPLTLSVSKRFKGSGLLLTILHDERLEVRAKIYGWIQRLDLTSSSSLWSLPSVIFTGLEFACAIRDVYLLFDRVC